jgi:uncharacterized membrane protein (DUF441 family)
MSYHPGTWGTAIGLLLPIVSGKLKFSRLDINIIEGCVSNIALKSIVGKQN